MTLNTKPFYYHIRQWPIVLGGLLLSIIYTDCFAQSNSTATNDDQEPRITLFLSGGGTRAAAFAYGAMYELNRLCEDGKITLKSDGDTPCSKVSFLDRIDRISAVSGGSIAAASYMLHPSNFFRDFPPC